MHQATKLQPPDPIRADLKSEWLLDPKITFLNHGSFGSVPKCVLVEQTRWRLRIEADPIEMLTRRRDELLEVAKKAVGTWLRMEPNDFGLVSNATEGINAVLRSLKLGPGDELLTTTHVYHAVRQAMKYVAVQSGAAYREIEIPLPIESPEVIVEQIANGLSAKTRLLVVDHVTSPTAVVFPVERIVAECASRGVDVLIDGAHAPGMVPLNVADLGAAYYAGNLHKWACAPKGSAFVWVRPDRQPGIHPLIISHFLGEGFAREFSWQGTRDISNWLSIPRALEFMSELGWDRIMSHNHAMATWAQRFLCESWNVDPISPADGSMLGCMATVPLPPPLDHLSESDVHSLQQRLHSEFKLEVPIVCWGGRTFVRPCCQVYNAPEDYQRLRAVVDELTRNATR
jgi:isopenicillin-N epimerase